MTENTSNKIFDTIKNIILIFILIITLYPFLNIIAISLNEASDTIAGGITIFPRKFTLYNYEKLLKMPIMSTAFLNSVLRTVIGVVAAILANSMVAYVLSNKRFLFRKQLNFLYVLTMYISGGLIPTYFLMRNLGLINSFHAYWIPWGVVPYYMIVIRTYMQGLPGSLMEAAEVEGANDFQVYYKIVMPLAKPVLATIALFTAVDQWNVWFDTFLYNSSKTELTTFQYEMQRMLQSAGTSGKKMPGDDSRSGSISPKALRAAMTVIVSLPIMCVYPFAQRYFVTGLTIGGVKG